MHCLQGAVMLVTPQTVLGSISSAPTTTMSATLMRVLGAMQLMAAACAHTLKVRHQIRIRMQGDGERFVMNRRREDQGTVLRRQLDASPWTMRYLMYCRSDLVHIYIFRGTL